MAQRPRLWYQQRHVIHDLSSSAFCRFRGFGIIGRSGLELWLLWLTLKKPEGNEDSRNIRASDDTLISRALTRIVLAATNDCY